MDGDDVATPGRLERQAAYLDDHPSVALVGGAATRDRRHRDRATTRSALRPATPDIRAEPRRAQLHHPPHGDDAPERARRQAGRLSGGVRHAEDYDLWLRLAERHQLANLPEVVLRYRVHPGQVSHLALEQQVLSALAAQAAARRRRAGLDEGLRRRRGESAGLDLAALGITEDAVRQCARRRRASIGPLISRDLDQPEPRPPPPWPRTPDFATSAEVRRRTLARYHALLARRRWSRGQLARSLASALRAVHARPALLGHLGRRLIRPAGRSVAP